MIDLAGFEDPRYAAETLAFAAMGVTGAPGYLGVDAGPATRLYLVPDDPQVLRATPDPVSLPRILLTGAGLIGRSARDVVTGYFSAKLPGGESVDVDFDTAGRIASVRLDTGTSSS